MGRQKLAGVTYEIYDFATSPVPTVVMLGGNGVPGKLPRQVAGIPVGRKADALFFLHAARIDRPLDRPPAQKKRFELFHYVVHYADGSQATVPVYSEVGVNNYRQAAVHALPERKSSDETVRGNAVRRGGLFHAMGEPESGKGDPVDRHGIWDRLIERRPRPFGDHCRQRGG